MFKLPLYRADVKHISERSNYSIKSCVPIHSIYTLSTHHLLTTLFYDLSIQYSMKTVQYPVVGTNYPLHSMELHWSMTLFCDVAGEKTNTEHSHKDSLSCLAIQRSPSEPGAMSLLDLRIYDLCSYTHSYICDHYDRRSKSTITSNGAITYPMAYSNLSNRISYCRST